MSLPGLLTFSQDPHAAAFFAFDHMMSHRTLTAAIVGATPTMTFGVDPYFIDPTFNNGKYHLNHWQAHIDALTNVPSYFGAETATGVFTNQNIRDTDLDNENERIWWTWQNHMEHRLATSVLPSPW